MDRGHILFVDDDVLTQWSLTEVLDQAGYSVTSACRAEEAIRLIGSGGGFDVLLTDVALPDQMTGVDLADFWRLTYPGRPVVYATHLPRGSVGSLEQDETFVQKPCHGPDLLRVLDEALDQAQFPVGRKISVRRSACVH